MNQLEVVKGLTLEGCWGRQHRLNSFMSDNDIDAVLLTDVRYVHYFTGYWNWFLIPRILLMLTEGPTVIVTGSQIEQNIAIDEQLIFPAAYKSTMIEDPADKALGSIRPRLRGLKRIGIDNNLYNPLLSDTFQIINLAPFLLSLRRAKDADEFEIICRSILACDSAYKIAREILTPGIREMEIYAQMQAAAMIASDEPIGEFGYDFQSGHPGGPPTDTGRSR